jgi:hypothetical protein
MCFGDGGSLGVAARLANTLASLAYEINNVIGEAKAVNPAPIQG